MADKSQLQKNLKKINLSQRIISDRCTAMKGSITEILTVSELNEKIRELLEARFDLLWVEGEVSNLRRPSSGISILRSRMKKVRFGQSYSGFYPDRGPSGTIVSLFSTLRKACRSPVEPDWPSTRREGSTS
jgi:hypothetical protein